MAKLRKMLGAADSPYILSLMSLIETQSKTTIGDWCVDYAEKYILNIYEKAFPEDDRLRLAVEAYRSYRKGELKLPELKKAVALTVQAAKEAEKNPAAQAAARTIGQAIGAVYTPHSLGLAFYGAAAIAYDRVGLEEKPGIRSDRRTGMRKDGRSAARLYGGE
ncbi:MAG: putative immunity protein [Eisenbergiella massiliensis]